MGPAVSSSALATFAVDAVDIVEEVERWSLVLEQSPSQPAALHGLFRALHTLKGAAACVGLTTLSELVHQIEDSASAVRDGRLTPTKAFIDAVLSAVDLFRRLVHVAEQGEAALAAVNGREAVLEMFAHTVESASGTGPVRSLGRQVVEMAFEESLSDMMEDPLLLLCQVADAGRSITVQLRDEALPRLEEMDTNIAYVSFRAVLEEPVQEADLWNIFALSTLSNRISVGRLSPEAPQDPFAQPAASPSNVLGSSAASADTATLRVSVHKLDTLLHNVGELVQSVCQSQTMLMRDDLDAPTKQSLLEDLDSTTRRLQETALDLRMVPLRTVFQGFQRTVRDLSSSLGKSVRLAFEGETTEVDKTVAEKIVDPLRHLVRNAIDHGLEPPETRAQAGKPTDGTILLAARHQGGEVVIEVSDDGSGVDLDAVRAKAVGLGILDASDDPEPQDVLKLLFHPGFSTSTSVTEVSGRGVGLDVVSTNIVSLGGSVGVNSQAGTGTQFRLCLPMSLMIVDAITTRVGEDRYSIPLPAIRHQLRPSAKQLATLDGEAEMLRLRDAVVPLVRLDRLFSVPGAIQDATQAVAVVVEHAVQPYAVLVDTIESQQQIVVKSLTKNFRDIAGLGGVATLGNGELSLVLDVRSAYGRAFDSAARR